jgi:hypothetical protein
MLHRNCLPKHCIEGKIEGTRRGPEQVVGDLKEKRR